MTPKLVDSHCHLDFEDFADDRAELLQRAREAGVGSILIAAVRQPDWGRVRALAEAEAEIWGAAGVHPNEPVAETPSYRDLLAALDHEKIVAVGETGLDYFRSEGDLAWQQERLALHVAAGRETGKPIIIHTREAAADTLALLRSENARDCGAVIHCFTESLDFARQAMDLGFYISFSGIVTFKNARDLQEVAKFIPLDRLLIETDAPYLAPVPMRGKRNEPGFVAYVARFLADLRGEDLDTLATVTSQNFRRLFHLPEPECAYAS
ncbi:TatD family hydrolase [Acidithiobacillus sp. AMEEHan]|uniref:TatD family hydrolase n=1 Tax=Acidithiobacillus sp. AMEEHan TaxID=2994951 RepID=UPI0027E528CB|nr:TatD family hydrolase [Acidithiobacillus sp. AMEEHan]